MPSTWGPDSSRLEGKALAPMFYVQAVKSYKPAEGNAGQEALLPFKRKQIITVLDWDESRDAIYGELDGKRGWFPSSYANIQPSVVTPPRSTVVSSGDDEISSAAAKRNSVPVDSKWRSSAGNKSPDRLLSPSEPTPAPTSPHGSFLSSPRVLGSLLGPILPSKKSFDDARRTVVPGNGATTTGSTIQLKNSHCNPAGVPLGLVVAIGYAKVENVQDQKKLFQDPTAPEEDVVALLSEMDSERVDMVKFSPVVVASALKRYLLKLSEPLLTFELYRSFAAAAEIEEEERRFSQFKYLLEMIPPQNYNVAATTAKFLRECTLKANVNGFDVESAGRIFSPVFCRPPAGQEDEESRGAQVAQLLIVNASELFKEPLDFADKKDERSREQRRKKEREMMSSYARNESRRVKKEEKKKEKMARKKLQLNVETISPPVVSDEAAGNPKTMTRSNSGILPKLGNPLSSRMAKPRSAIVMSPPRVRSNTAEGGPLITPRKEARSVVVPSDPKTSEDDVVARTMARFYRVGFYVALVVFVLSHLLRSLL